MLDRKALRELILRFAMLLHETSEIMEADLNPSAAQPTAASCSTRGFASSPATRGTGGNGAVDTGALEAIPATEPRTIRSHPTLSWPDGSSFNHRQNDR